MLIRSLVRVCSARVTEISWKSLCTWAGNSSKARLTALRLPLVCGTSRGSTPLMEVHVSVVALVNDHSQGIELLFFTGPGDHVVDDVQAAVDNEAGFQQAYLVHVLVGRLGQHISHALVAERLDLGVLAEDLTGFRVGEFAVGLFRNDDARAVAHSCPGIPFVDRLEELFGVEFDDRIHVHSSLKVTGLMSRIQNGSRTGKAWRCAANASLTDSPRAAAKPFRSWSLWAAERKIGSSSDGAIRKPLSSIS